MVPGSSNIKPYPPIAQHFTLLRVVIVNPNTNFSRDASVLEDYNVGKGGAEGLSATCVLLCVRMCAVRLRSTIKSGAKGFAFCE